MAFAPYDVSDYRELLLRLQTNAYVDLPPFDAAGWGCGGSRTRVFIRHDVDTVQCVAQLGLLLELNVETGVPAAVFLRMDGTDYDPNTIVKAVHRFGNLGIGFGLHTSAYVQDDYLAALNEEVNVFKAVMGFAPRWLTVHGLGDFRLDVRERLVAEVTACLGEFGFSFTDAHTHLRQYRYVIQDCHLDAVTGRRYMYNDFVTAERFFWPRFDYLVLTHPGYWRANGRS